MTLKVVPLERPRVSLKEPGPAGPETVRRARILVGYMPPNEWRGWCERRGLIVEEVDGRMSARLPDADGY